MKAMNWLKHGLFVLIATGVTFGQWALVRWLAGASSTWSSGELVLWSLMWVFVFMILESIWEDWN